MYGRREKQHHNEQRRTPTFRIWRRPLQAVKHEKGFVATGAPCMASLQLLLVEIEAKFCWPVPPPVLTGDATWQRRVAEPDIDDHPDAGNSQRSNCGCRKVMARDSLVIKEEFLGHRRCTRRRLLFPAVCSGWEQRDAAGPAVPRVE